MIYLDEQKSSAILVKTIWRVLSALEISTVVSYENSSEYSLHERREDCISMWLVRALKKWQNEGNEKWDIAQCRITSKSTDLFFQNL